MAHSGSIPALRCEHWRPGGATGEARLLGGFLRVLELDADDAAGHADAFGRLRAGELQAIVVHRVYEPAVLAGVVQRLERHDPSFLRTAFPEKFRSWFFGRNLNLAAPGLPGYFAEAERFHEQLRALFPAELDPTERVAALLARLDGGRPFLPAPGPVAGLRYMFTTLREHAEDGYIPPHFDNEQALRPSFAHLRTVVDRHMTSFVLVLSAPEGGGALEVFDLAEEPEHVRLMSDDRAGAKPDVSRFASVAFGLSAGSLIVLDSGRYLHRLTPVRGPRSRWTACSFMALSRDHRATYCWG